MQPVPCANCGAMMDPARDGRTYQCRYCQTRVEVAIEAEQIAAGMSLDLADIEAFLARLASTLMQGFGEHTKVEMRGHAVHALEVDLDPDHFIARREGGRVVAEHKKVVRGIALRTNRPPLDRWVELLTEALARHANTNARAAWVLGQLGGKGGGLS